MHIRDILQLSRFSAPIRSQVNYSFTYQFYYFLFLLLSPKNMTVFYTALDVRAFNRYARI